MKKLARYMRWQKQYSYSHYIVYLIKNTFFTIAAEIVSRRGKVYEEKVNVVFLSRSKGGLNFKNIIDSLPPETSYINLKEPDPLTIIKKRMLLSPGSRAESFIFHIYELYSNFLLKKYNPEVVMTDCNGSVLHPFLSTACYMKKSKHMHIAHSIPTMNYSQFSLIPYDYYLVYGVSSYDNTKNRPCLYGQTKFIFTGSHQINSKISSLNNIVTNSEVFLLIGSGPGYEKKDTFTQKFYEMVIKYISERPSSVLVFKPHPRSDSSLWRMLTNGLNSEKFIKSELFPKPSNQVKVAFCGYTNAILDVAKLGVIPCLISDNNKENDFFNFKDYLFESVDDYKDLVKRVDDIINNQEYYQSKLTGFINYHLEDVQNPEMYINEIIQETIKTGTADRFVNAEL